MFRPKKVTEFSFTRVLRKFLNDRESIQRIKHLRTIIDNHDCQNLKSFFNQYFSLIFNAFYDVFSSVQMELQLKINISHYKELQNILSVLEKLFIYMPEYIYDKWQFHCIHNIILILLSPKNIFKVRIRGVRLFLIWFQILKHNAPPSCIKIYISLIPSLQSIIKENLCSNHFKENNDISPNLLSIMEVEIKPILTQNIDKETEPDNPDQHLLRYLLRFMVTEGVKVEWETDNEAKQLESYNFLFEKFKEFYLPIIFPKCSDEYTLERNQQMALMSNSELENHIKEYDSYPISYQHIALYQEEVIRWLSDLVHNNNILVKANETNDRAMGNIRMSSMMKNFSIENFIVKFDDDTLTIKEPMREKMKRILLENKENIIVVNQLFQFSFYLPIKFYKAHFCVLSVYKSWLFSSNPPDFMKEDNSTTVVVRNMENLFEYSSDSIEKIRVSRLMQRVIFTNTGIIFLHTVSDRGMSGLNSSPIKRPYHDTNLHSELVRKIMEFIHRKSINCLYNLDFEHLMNVLLDIGFKVLTMHNPDNRPQNHWISNDSSIGQFFQTLNVLIIRSSLVNHISEELWNRYLIVYSKLSNWSALISEWKKTIELLIKMLARYLYRVDMNDLPLEKLERRKIFDKKCTSMSKIQSKTNKRSGSDSISQSIVTGNSLASMQVTMNYYLENVNKNTQFMDEVCNNTASNMDTQPKIEDDVQVENNRCEQVLDTESNPYSSHEENSSYASAEDSSSPNYLDKKGEAKSNYNLDKDSANSSFRNESSFEGNECPSYETKKFLNAAEDSNADADDECDETEPDNGQLDNYNCRREGKTGTLTREEGDIDCTSNVIGINYDNTKTPTKSTLKRKSYHPKNSVRNSMNIEENINVFASDSLRRAISTDNINSHHVIMGGSGVGWTEESVVILWRRCLGLLGNIAFIQDKHILVDILDFLEYMTDTFIKLRKNMCVSFNQSLPLVPPLDAIVPWLFQLFQSDKHEEDVKLISIKIICKITVRRHDIEPPIYHLCQFYKMVHQIIQSENMNLIVTLINNFGSNFFAQPLAGCEILIPDFIKASEMILMSPKNDDIKETPKLEVLIILGQILFLLKQFTTVFKVFKSDSAETQITESGSYKKSVLNILMHCVKCERLLPPRVLSILVVGNYCYSEILNWDTAPNDINEIRQCILQILSFTRSDNVKISLVSIEFIRALVNCYCQIQEKLPHIPEKIIQVLSWTIIYNWKQKKSMLSIDYQRIMFSLIFTLIDWCMILPLSQLIDSNDLHSKGLIHLTFNALETILQDDGESEIELISSQNDMKRSSDMNDPLPEYPFVIETLPPTEESILHNKENFNVLKCSRVIKLASRTALCHLINHVGQFPKNNNLESFSSCVQEYHDIHESNTENANDINKIFESDRINLFIINGSFIVSLIAINDSTNFNEAPGGPPVYNQCNMYQSKEVRVIVRDMCGKYCWDLTFIPKNENLNLSGFSYNEDSTPPSPPPRRNPPYGLSEKISNTQKSPENIKSGPDNVFKLFEDLNENSSELFSKVKNKILDSSQVNLELLAKQQIIDQNSIEKSLFDTQHCLKISHPKISEKKLRLFIPFECSESTTNNSQNSVYFCRQILTQLGFLSWKRRSTIDVINKSKFLLHLKGLDNHTKCRDTHKIAILYIDWSQEDKDSILSNVNASLEFNNFIGGLGWPVSLEEHRGFMGGLDTSGKSGLFAPYFANSTMEVLFHVSTWMPSGENLNYPSKFKHLGNDDVMIIWSENYRDYQLHIAKTQFGDITIIIYPMRNGLYSISIKKKRETRLFGPLFDGAIVGERELPGLVRATAINAGRVVREFKQHYQEHFIERASFLENAIRDFKIDMSYESFAESIFGNKSDSNSKNCQQDFPYVSCVMDSNRNISSQKNSDYMDWSSNREFRR